VTRPPDGPAWVVLPTYDEAENVVPMIEAVLGVADAEGIAIRVLVVDDGSPDGTAGLAEGVAARDARVAVMRRGAKEGIGPAYRAGFRRALAEGAGAVVEMDCDFSHDPAVVPALLAALDDGADLALGSRYVGGGRVENWTAWRRAVSRGGCLYAQAVLRAPVRDLTGGFKAFRADALRAIDYRTARAKGYAFQVELTYRALRAGLRVTELPIVFRERREGESKMSGAIALEAAWRVPALRLQFLARGADVSGR
jgi:dolichol-phosphate mannosyltransferase